MHKYIYVYKCVLNFGSFSSTLLTVSGAQNKELVQ